MNRRGDVVIVNFSFTDVAKTKPRPAIIVQNDRDNQRLRKTVVVMITGNLTRRGDPSHFVIDPATPEGASSGIRNASLASCNNVLTLEQQSVLRTIGHLSDTLKQKLSDCLKAALEIT